MKRSALVFLLAIAGPLHAAPIDDAAALLKSGKYPEAAAAFAALPPDAGEPGYAVYLKALLDFAEEAVNPVAAGEANPRPDWKKAASLCEKVLDLPITAGLRAEVPFRKAMLYHKAGQHLAAEGAFHAWLLLADPEWSPPFGPGKRTRGRNSPASRGPKPGCIAPHTCSTCAAPAMRGRCEGDARAMRGRCEGGCG